MPLQVHQLTDEVPGAAAGRQGAVLVRPDGHVAWRGDRQPENALDVVDRVRGAGSRGARQRQTREGASQWGT